MYAISVYVERGSSRVHMTHWSVTGGRYQSITASDVLLGPVWTEGRHREQVLAEVLDRLARHLRDGHGGLGAPGDGLAVGPTSLDVQPRVDTDPVDGRENA